ncbi:hypothetical protein ONA91_11010 [Micromonospora sp. DR5-3]|uniref:glycosyltransferase n=1 Tax=unclassified Micromonospora TaxID=2617518 RepID=UPI0011DACAC5|nr:MULTISPECIES: hypothetical protein [unclassified Micromonospora]MCW3814985.1 hypothetical protein [Micromonospora sp. DR5-3]TYC25311.1 hypothetical protein FXF52_05765 [Micromonospora sp. MP36]
MTWSTERVTLAIGPANYAGQAYHWAVAAQRHRGVPATSFAFDLAPPGRRRHGDFRFPVHHRVPAHRLTTPWGRAVRLSRALRTATHVAVDGFLPLSGPDLEADLRGLVGQGRRLALIAHGTEVRDPEAHRDRLPFSYYADADRGWVDAVRRAAGNRALATRLGLPVFVSTPDLLLDLQSATWLPVTVDPRPWSTARPALAGGGPPVVLHRPSRSLPPIKGTELVDPILRDLAARGLIRYLRPESVPHDAMPALVAQADVVVDQILTGSYGVAAVEGLAAGRLVVGYVCPATRALMPEDPPVVDAPPSTFGEVMRRIVADPESFARRAAQGPRFVRRWHDGRTAAAVLAPFCGVTAAETAATAGGGQSPSTTINVKTR